MNVACSCKQAAAAALHAAQSARVTIKISDRAKMDPQSQEREVVVSGLHSGVTLAEAMISEKLNQSRARMRAAEEGHDEH